MKRCGGDELYRGKCVRGRRVVVLDCETCGYAHLHPKPSEKVLRAYYRKQYFTTEKPDYAKKSGTESGYQRLVDWEKIERIETDWPALRILDFGCGPTASFLKNARELCDDDEISAMEGYEPSNKAEYMQPMGNPKMASWVLRIVNRLELVSFMPNLIHMGFVLEHVRDPLDVLKQAHKWLLHGGFLIAEVPNDGSYLQEECKKPSQTPWWVSSPDHVNYFKNTSLRRLVERAGFKVVEIRTTFPVELALLLGCDYTRSKKAGRIIVEQREKLQNLWGASEASKQELLGRTIWCVARKEI